VPTRGRCLAEGSAKSYVLDMAIQTRAAPERQQALSTHVALLRGINVGGKNKLPMKVLVPTFTEIGCQDVVSYIQSGNVIFKAAKALAVRVPELIQVAIERKFGLRVPVIVRSAEQLNDVRQRNPFLGSNSDVEHLHVAFLAGPPKARQIAALDWNRSPPDRFFVRGQEVFLHLPNGVARTKLTNAYLDATLATTSTMRNWNTVQKLLELLDG
jgi:uncharacterized protein (DUF1697 family)